MFALSVSELCAGGSAQRHGLMTSAAAGEMITETRTLTRGEWRNAGYISAPLTRADGALVGGADPSLPAHIHHSDVNSTFRTLGNTDQRTETPPGAPPRSHAHRRPQSPVKSVKMVQPSMT